MEFKHVLKGKEFIVTCDKESILSAIQKDREKFQENYFQAYGTIGADYGYLTEQEYQSNLDDIENTLTDLLTPEKIALFVSMAPKKKDGTFCRGRVIFEEGTGNCEFITDWHNTWIYNALKIKSIKNTTLEIFYTKVVDTPA